LTNLSPATGAKRLQLLAEVVPQLAQVGALTSGGPAAEREWAETQAAAQPLQVQLTALKVGSAAEFPGAFADATRQHLQALLLFDIGGMGTAAVMTQLVELATQHRLPMMVQDTGAVRRGILMSYEPDSLDLCRRAATYVDRILKGANPAELAVGEPTKFILAINLKARNYSINPSILESLPYAMTIIVLVAVSTGWAKRRLGAPASLGVPYEREER
jgi:putative ABC transport system substrate-binding protein